MKRQKPLIGGEVAQFVGWFWRVFYAMGCNLFYAVLIFPLNAMTEGRFCSIVWRFFYNIDDAALQQC